MLHFIRDRAQGWIAWFVVGLITIPFALWGVNSYLTGPSDVIVAEVNGEPIKQTALQRAVQQYRDQMRNVLGDRFDPAMFEGEQVKHEVLDGLIEQQLLQAASQQLGQYISDAEISQVVRTTQAFQRDGKFDPEYYKMVLTRAGYTPIRYESQLRNDLLEKQLTQSIQRSGIATASDVSGLLSVEKQQREIAYGIVPVVDFTNQVEIDEAAVKNYYDLNSANYMAPEQVKLNYIQLSVDDLAANVDVDEAALKQFYADNKEKFVASEQRRASHILIEGDNDEALSTIKDIQQKLAAGEDFAELAKTYSQDTGSAENGGDLGFFQRDVMDPAFDAAVFAMQQIGDISEPVKTEYGYHLIKLTAIQKADSEPFTDVRGQVEKLYRKQQAETVFYDKAEQLANLTYENPENLDIAAETLGLEIKTTESFTRKGGQSGIATEQKVIDVAFSDDVLQEELNSAVIELSSTNLVVVHKNQYTPATLLPFESVAPAIREQLKFEKASDLAKTKGESLLTELKSGGSAEQLFANWQAEKRYSRDSDDISGQILQHAYAMPKPEATAQYKGFTASNGNYIVIKLSAVDEGDVSTVSADDKSVLKGQLARMYADAELQAFIAALKAEADIEIHNEYLK